MFFKLKVINKVEENGNIIYGVYEWFFGNGGENNRYYGWLSFLSGRIFCEVIFLIVGS